MIDSSSSASIIRSWLQGINVDPNSLQAPYSTVLREAIRLLPEHDEFRPSALDAALAKDPSNSIALRDEISQAADASLRETSKREVGDLLIPRLPESVRYNPLLAQQAGTWVDIYVPWADAASPMTPSIFHESAALTLGSIAIARRLVIRMAFGDVYPNLYTVWLAPSTLYHKTTAFNKARGLARQAMPHLLAPQDTTPEALLESMSGKEPANLADLPEPFRQRWEQGRSFSAQQGLMLDELSGLINGSQKDYNAGLVEAFLRFYDCDEEFTRLTATKGLLVIRNSYVTLLGASTSAAMAQHIAAARMWANGWWPRFALLTPEPMQPTWRPARLVDQPEELQRTLDLLTSRLPSPTYPNPPEARSVVLGGGVIDLWEPYVKAMTFDLLTPALDERLWALYGRLPTQLLKVATVYAALDWATTNRTLPTIEMPHFVRALLYVEKCRESAHRVLSMATQTNQAKLKDRVLAVIASCEPDGVTVRNLSRRIGNTQTSELQRTLADLVKVSEVEEIQVKPGKQGGRPTTRYRLVKE